MQTSLYKILYNDVLISKFVFMFYKKYIFLFLLFFAVNLYAQQSNINNITIANGLPSNIIYDVQQDEIGYLWLATEKGLVKFDGNNFTQITKQKSTSVLIKNDIIYTGLENGLTIIKNTKKQFFETPKTVKIIALKNDIYTCTKQGIYKLEKGSLKPLKINTTVDFSIINDLIYINNSFYTATSKGLWKIDDLENTNKTFKIIDDNLISLTVFQDKILAVTANNSLKIIEKNSVLRTITTQSDISSIKKIKNEIWLTSNKNGIEIYALPSFTFKRKINKYNATISNAINTVFIDRQNSIWAASNNGLYNLRESKSANLSNKKPKIYFENLLINHQNADSLLAKNITVNLSSSENNISISFKTVNLSQPKSILYRYKLETIFSPWTTKNEVQFPNLKSGKYTFKIQSLINNKKSEIKNFSFKIDDVFYKKTWFIIATTTLFLFISYLVLDFYLKKIKKVNSEKIKQLKLENHLLTLEQKALQLQMNPHFIFNVLNGIKALGNSGKIEELNTSISQFSVLLRSILTNSRKEEISLKEEIKSLKNYIELEQSMSSKTFNYQILTDLNNIDVDEILIPTMLIQPFVENAIEHGFEINKKGTIEIIFNVKYNFLECSIIDNGIGIHQSKRQKKNSNHNSVALKVSKERIENISTKNSFYIDEIKENSIIKGTKIWFKVPLKTDY